MAKDGSAPRRGLTAKVDENAPGPSPVITFRLTREDQKTISDFAKRTGRRVSTAVRDIVLHYFKNIDEDLEAAGEWTTAQAKQDDGFVDYTQTLLDLQKENQKLKDEGASKDRKIAGLTERFDSLNRQYWVYREAMLRLYRHQMKSPKLKASAFGSDIKGLEELGLMGAAGTSGLQKPNGDQDDDKKE